MPSIPLTGQVDLDALGQGDISPEEQELLSGEDGQVTLRDERDTQVDVDRLVLDGLSQEDLELLGLAPEGVKNAR